jgi:hypothetical protein
MCKQVASILDEYLDTTLRVYESVRTALPRFQNYVDALAQCPTMRDLIDQAFKIWVDQSLRCIKAFRGGHFRKSLPQNRKLERFTWTDQQRKRFSIKIALEEGSKSF